MKVHFIGIGGIGVSALAQFYLEKGHDVSGSDLVASEITDYLKKKGAKIYIGKHKKENVKEGIELVICSPAVKPENLEYKAAKKLKAKIQTYPEALGDLTKEYFTIAVSGTHGKSTTTAMIALALAKADIDPTVIIGTKVKEFGGSAEGTNFRIGTSKVLVIEADEHFSSFLNYWPKIIVLTNIEREHLDHYKNLGNILKTYKKYVGHLNQKDCYLVANTDDENIRSTIAEFGENPIFKIEKYGAESPEFSKIKKIMSVPGKHNVYNALAVVNVARIMAVPDEITYKALSEFEGTWRRFEIRQGSVSGKKFTLISDYGHHPTEIAATLSATREKYPKKKIWCVFQPHQHQRTYYLFKEFVKTFQEALSDNIIITDIYDVAGRETKQINAEVSSEKLVKKINKKSVIYLQENELEKYIKENIGTGDVLVVMGAGSIYKFAEKF